MIATDEKLLTFSLGEEEYGVPILKVKEIIGMLEITSVPKTPDFLKGVINLRGKIIPVMDLRLKFGMDEHEYDERTCIIVVELILNGVERQIGVVVDMVSEVVSISTSEIEPPPEYDSSVDNNFIIGIGKIKEKVVVILEINKIFQCDELIKMVENLE